MKYNELKDMYIGEVISAVYGYCTPKKISEGFLIPHTNNSSCYSIIESLNIQTSKYHKESLLDHIAMVTYRKNEKFENDKLALTIAILHDIGKKFTIKVNNIGDICYYNHELVSSQIAEELMLSSNNYSAEEVKICCSVIEAHLQLKLLKGISRECFIEGFRSIYGTKALEYLIALDESDEGVSDNEYLKTNEYIDIVTLGEQLILDFNYI